MVVACAIPALAPRTTLTASGWGKDGAVINHYEKLLKLKDQLNKSAAKQLVEHRQQVMLSI